jgi:hypothetical protein
MVQTENGMVESQKTTRLKLVNRFSLPSDGYSLNATFGSKVGRFLELLYETCITIGAHSERQSNGKKRAPGDPLDD